MIASPLSKAKFDAVIFDLDGTLVNSGKDLSNSVNYTRDKMGLPPIPEEMICSYIGDGVSMLIRRAMGPEANDEQVDQAIAVFTSYYEEHMLDNTRLYPGVAETLEQLSGLVLAVLTNKHVSASDFILRQLGVRDRFSVIYGGNSFEQKKPDPIGLLTILKDYNIDSKRAMIVGDSRVDVETGQNAGISTCGVTYGLSSHTLQNIKPNYLVSKMLELPAIVYEPQV